MAKSKKVQPIIIVIPSDVVAIEPTPATLDVVASDVSTLDVVQPTDPAPTLESSPEPTPAPIVEPTDEPTPATLDVVATEPTESETTPALFTSSVPIAPMVDSAIVSPSSMVNPANVQPTPEPDATPAPIVAPFAPNISTPAYVPKLSKAGTVKALAYVVKVAKVLNVGNALLLAWGKCVQDIVKTERENSTVFGSAEFDSTLAECAALFKDRFPDAESAPRILNHFQYAEFMDGCTTLGIVGAESLAFGKVVNRLYPACFVTVKDSATSTVRLGWADWLKAIVPLATSGTDPPVRAFDSVQHRSSTRRASRSQR